MPITSQIYEEKQLTVFAATGELSFAEVRNAITSLSGLDESIPAMDEALSWLA